jgi:ABC-type glycerol-3-phosphate transport system permease component
VATVIGLMVGALGAIAAVIAIAARLRLALVPTPRRPVGQGGVIASVVVLLVTVGLLAVPLIPWVSALSANGQTRGGSYVHTWGPALIHALVAVPLAYLAALGISGFRPLGKGSEWLLLPLAPWLFVGVTPLAVQGFRDYKDLGLLNDFLGLIPPILVSVPALFLFALFFRGQSARWRAAPEKGFFESVVVPSLPLLGLLIGAVTLIDAQNLLWPLLIMSDPGHATMPEAIAIGSRQYLGGGVDLGTATPWLIVGPALVVLAAAQFRYLDRLVLTSGEKD